MFSMLTLFRNRASRALRVAGNDATIFHLVYPIAGFRDRWIVRDQK